MIEQQTPRCGHNAEHERQRFTCRRRSGHPGPHRDQVDNLGRVLTVVWGDDGQVTDDSGRPLLKGTVPRQPSTARRRRSR